MRAILLVSLTVALGLAGCLTGDSYPQSYANTYCSSLYLCMDSEEIEFWFGYDDEGECSEGLAETVREGFAYQSWKDGDCGFDSEAAANCQDEVAEIVSDSDCGSMDFFTWSLDSYSDECSEVYCD